MFHYKHNYTEWAKCLQSYKATSNYYFSTEIVEF